MARWFLLGMLLATSGTFSQQLGAAEFRVGGKVPSLTVYDLKGARTNFTFAGKPTVVLFISTECPVSARYNVRMKDLYRDYSAKGVQFLFLNSDFNESASQVAEHARNVGYPFPVYKDPKNVVADRFGAQFTPEAFLIDKDGVIRYHGRIDDAQMEARIKDRSLANAIDAVQAGATVQQPETKAFGCTIKRAGSPAPPRSGS